MDRNLKLNVETTVVQKSDNNPLENYRLVIDEDGTERLALPETKPVNSLAGIDVPGEWRGFRRLEQP